MDGFVWVSVSSLFLSLKSCIADPDFYCFNFLRQIYLSPCQINGFCHRNLCDFVPCGDLASQVCAGWFGKLNPRPCLAMLAGNNKNWKKQRPNNHEDLTRKYSSKRKKVHKRHTTHTPRQHIPSKIRARVYFCRFGDLHLLASSSDAPSAPGLQPYNSDCNLIRL